MTVFKSLFTFLLLFSPLFSHAFVLISNVHGEVPPLAPTFNLFASFVAPQSIPSGSTIYYQIEVDNTSGFPTCAEGMYVTISSSSTFPTNIFSHNIPASTSTTGFQKVSSSNTTSGNITAFSNYYVSLHSQCNPGDFSFKNLIFTTQPQETASSSSFKSTYLTRFTDQQIQLISTTATTSILTGQDAPQQCINLEDQFEVTTYPDDNPYIPLDTCGSGNAVNDAGIYYLKYYESSSLTRTTIFQACDTTCPSNPQNTIEIDADYFINLPEINTTISNRNPTLVQYELTKRPNTTVDTKQGETINNQIQGTSTVSTTFTDLTDGTYDVYTHFSNIGCSLDVTDCPFPLSYIYTSFTLNNGTLSTTTNELYENTTVSITDIQYQDCHVFNNPVGCLVNAGIYLFVPSEQAINQLTSVFTDSELPFVQTMYSAFSGVTTISENQTPVSTLTLDLEIPQAGIDVEMFSVARMTELMGDSQPLFRSIILIALYLGLLMMVYTSINRMVSYRSEYKA